MRSGLFGPVRVITPGDSLSDGGAR
jgi:hypothetical protein